MKNGFSTIDILIIIGVIVCVFLGYQKYFKQESFVGESQKEQSVGQEATSTESKADNVSPIENEKNINTPSEEKKQDPKAVDNNNNEDSEKISEEQTKKGFYKNNDYYYQITFPESWPLKIRSSENVSIGIVPPKNGYGAITIEISTEINSEIEEAKKEVKKYPGLISISEEDITMADVKGTRMILNNMVSGVKNIYIILEKYGTYYLLKYTEESPDFTKQAEKVLSTFEFIRQ